MGCVCCSLSSFVSILLDALERISICTVCAMLTCCLLLTIMTVMILGIGIGYHYCFVQSSVEAMEEAAKAAGGGGRRSGGGAAVDVMRSVDRAVKNSVSAHNVKRREADIVPQALSNNNTLNELHRSKYALFNASDTFNNTHYALFNATNLTAASL